MNGFLTRMLNASPAESAPTAEGHLELDCGMNVLSMAAPSGSRVSLNVIVRRCNRIKQWDLLRMASGAKRSSCPGHSELLAVTPAFHALALFWLVSVTPPAEAPSSARREALPGPELAWVLSKGPADLSCSLGCGTAGVQQYVCPSLCYGSFLCHGPFGS